mmetsp:Transcript_44632/g.112137  ORF Transcript_44632/g.112137 Transcript_44632/m.112137 type:complete len:211 (+) Transcript_44632:351-983(+)
MVHCVTPLTSWTKGAQRPFTQHSVASQPLGKLMVPRVILGTERGKNDNSVLPSQAWLASDARLSRPSRSPHGVAKYGAQLIELLLLSSMRRLKPGSVFSRARSAAKRRPCCDAVKLMMSFPASFSASNSASKCGTQSAWALKRMKAELSVLGRSKVEHPPAISEGQGPLDCSCKSQAWASSQKVTLAKPAAYSAVPDVASPLGRAVIILR